MTSNSAERADQGAQRALRRQRWQLLARLDRALEPVFVVLSAVWIVLVVIELATGSLPRSLDALVWIIWALFIGEFALGLLIAPSRFAYVRKRWLTVLSLLLPAFRIVRIAGLVRLLRTARVARSVGLLRIVTSINRGLGALGRTAQRRGVGYVVLATAIVVVVGAAGMAFFEGPLIGATSEPGAPEPAATGLAAYADALWWTAYAMTQGAPTLPRTGEGRLLGWVLSIYGLAVFGYLTAILASHFVGRDIGQPARGAGAAARRGPPSPS